MAVKSMMAPPDPAASKLIEPGKPAQTITAAADTGGGGVRRHVETPTRRRRDRCRKLQRTEFGVDVGGANSVGRPARAVARPC